MWHSPLYLRLRYPQPRFYKNVWQKYKIVINTANLLFFTYTLFKKKNLISWWYLRIFLRITTFISLRPFFGTFFKKRYVKVLFYPLQRIVFCNHENCLKNSCFYMGNVSIFGRYRFCWKISSAHSLVWYHRPSFTQWW